MEISMLCGQDVTLVIHDRRKSKLVTFQSSSDFNAEKVEYLTKALKTNDLYENYSNKDYDSLCDTKIVTCQAREWKNYTYKNTIVSEDELSYDSHSDIALHESLDKFDSEKYVANSDSHITRRQEKQLLKFMRGGENLL